MWWVAAVVSLFRLFCPLFVSGDPVSNTLPALKLLTNSTVS